MRGTLGLPIEHIEGKGHQVYPLKSKGLNGPSGLSLKSTGTLGHQVYPLIGLHREGLLVKLGALGRVKEEHWGRNWKHWGGTGSTGREERATGSTGSRLLGALGGAKWGHCVYWEHWEGGTESTGALLEALGKVTGDQWG